MRQLRLVLCAAALAMLAGCGFNGPERASNIQNVNGVSDDISATTMTQSGSDRTHDPNLPSVYPHTFQTYDTP
jgi:outer membrane lipopolysaccharide assembly protein LptE/RlpB